MKYRIIKIFLSLILGFFLIHLFSLNKLEAGLYTLKAESKSAEKKISESWMGVYMKGIKVGYSHSQELMIDQQGKRFKKSLNESWLRVTRLGGNPVEIKTIEESLYDEKDKPLKVLVRTKMAENETFIRAEITPDKILFKAGDKVAKEMPYNEEFYLGIPLKKIVQERGLAAGRKYEFKILDPISYSLVTSQVEVLGREEVLILGKKMNLWHVKSETAFIIPLTTEEWIDNKGEVWKSETKTSFLTTTSIKMSKEKALKISGENFDIAFSSLIRSNVSFDNPQQLRKITFKLSGISPDRIKKFPFDDGSQRILEIKDDYALIQTTSQILTDKEAVNLPITDEKLSKFLKPSFFCQSDDPEIKKAAQEIVGQEKNSWRAAKKIAEWVNREITANYDVGFASAKEIIKNRQGDCSEYTVITVALCRAAGIPARAAVGIMYGQGFFAYHMWPEVYVGRWIGLDSKWLAVDEASGQYYTDATHIKFGRSLLDENIFKEMAQAVSEIIGQLKLEIIDY